MLCPLLDGLIDSLFECLLGPLCMLLLWQLGVHLRVGVAGVFVIAAAVHSVGAVKWEALARCCVKSGEREQGLGRLGKALEEAENERVQQQQRAVTATARVLLRGKFTTGLNNLGKSRGGDSKILHTQHFFC